MKERTTKTKIYNIYDKVISVPYCELQSILYSFDPVAYTARAEGWAADVYSVGYNSRGEWCAIVTGYSPFGNVKTTYTTCSPYEEKAREIRNKVQPYEVTKAELEKLLYEFVEAVTA